MRNVMMLCILFFFIPFKEVMSQENNQSIGDELKTMWEGQRAGDIINMDGVYDTQAGSDFENEIGFGNTGGTDTLDTPIDGGLGFLLAAGIGYAANGMRKRRKKKENLDNQGCQP